MNEATSVPSFRQRCILAIVAVIFFALITGVIALGVLNGILFFLLLGGTTLVLEIILVMAAWRHGVRWFFTRRAWRFDCWLIVGLFSVVVLFYAEENWRGRRAWAALVREAAARGESLELSSAFPPAVVDDQNFALAPGVGRVLGYAESGTGDVRTATDTLSFYHGTPDKWPAANWALQKPTDLADWQQFIRRHPAATSGAATNSPFGLRFPVAPQPQSPAADVLLGLSRFDADLAVLRDASRLPSARYPLDCSQGIFALNHQKGMFLENLFSAAHVLGLRASAELAAGRPDAAMQDVLLALRLADSLRKEQFWREHNYRALMLMFALQPLWEGLAEHRWTDPQLATLQERCTAMDLPSDFRRAMRGETLATMDLADQFLAFRTGASSPMVQWFAEAEGADRFWAWLARTAYPTGWLYLDKVCLYRVYQNHSASLQDPRLFAPAEQGWGAELHGVLDPLFLIFVVPHIRGFCQDAVAQGLYTHTAFQQATAACALERWRLTHGQYPASLDALVPNLLQQVPRDTLDRAGGALKYRPTQDSGFVLYSVGLDGVDDDGKPEPGLSTQDWRGPQNAFPSLSQGDWVWRQSAATGGANGK